MKTLLAILLLSLAASAQVYVGKADNLAYFIDNVKRNGDKVTFSGIVTPFHADENNIYIDPDNELTTSFVANCMSFEYFATGFAGKVHGKPVGSKEHTEPMVAEAPQIVFYALEAACKK